VAVNPYKRFPIYTPTTVKLYMGKRRSEVPPHLFAISDKAYRNMIASKMIEHFYTISPIILLLYKFLILLFNHSTLQSEYAYNVSFDIILDQNCVL
jgi:hypothetical protein